MAQRFWEKFNQGLETGTKIWNADSERRMRAELAAANKMAPEQQTLGLNAPQAGAVPTGYEQYIQAGEGGGFVPRVEEGLTPDQVSQRQVMAERFSAPTAFAGEQTSYSLGGVSQAKPFTAADVANARMERKADIYSEYGKEDVAEQLRANALARKAAALNIEKLQEEVDDKKAFRADLTKATDMLGSAASVATQAKQLMESGDREGAARLIADWRSKNVPDDRMIRVNENGLLEGSKDGGKTWVQASADKGNVYNPGVVENMITGVRDTSKEHLNRLMFKHASSPESLNAMSNAAENLALEREKFAEGKSQFEKTYGLSERKVGIEERQGDAKIKLMGDELKQKGLLIPSEIQKNLGIGAHYRTANALQDYQLQNLRGFDTEKNAIIKDLDDKKITQEEAQRRLNIAGMKFGGKLTETKPITSTALKDIEEIAASRYTDWAKMPEAKKAEVRTSLKAELGFGSAAAPVDYMGVATADKGSAPAGGLQNKTVVTAPQVDTSNWSIGQGQLARNPAAVRDAIISARNSRQPLDPQLLEVARYLDTQQPGIFDAGVTGNANTVWLHNQ